MTGNGPAEPQEPPTDAERAYSWLVRAVGGKFGYLLGALVALLLSSPLIVDGWTWTLLIGVFASAVLVAGLHAARPGRRSLTIGLTLAVLDFSIGRLVFIEGARWLVVLQAFLWLSALIFVTLTILGAVFERKDVDAQTLQASLCVYLLLGLIWVHVYALIALSAPGSFQAQGVPHVAWTDDPSRRGEFVRLIVFSYSTLASSGFGALQPASDFASMCANLESLTAQVYLAVVIARLVGMQAAKGPPGRI